MDKDFLKKRVGSLEQIVYARRMTVSGGKAEGMKVIEVKNASGLSLTLLESRCLDITQLNYKGKNIGFLSKAGLVSPQNYGVALNDFTQHFGGGMLYTCGLTNIGPAEEVKGKKFPIHGHIGMTPAEEASAIIDWKSEDIIITGKMRTASLFGENIVLERKITIPISNSIIKISDTVINEGYSDEDIMLLYHFNFGHPMLGEDLTLHINESEMQPRDAIADAGKDKWDTFERPTVGRLEEVFYHNPNAERDALVHVKLNNSKLNIGAELVFDKAQLPELIQWKSMMAGDYALGVEPATARVGGYSAEKAAGRVITFKAGEKLKYKLSLRLFDL